MRYVASPCMMVAVFKVSTSRLQEISKVGGGSLQVLIGLVCLLKWIQIESREEVCQVKTLACSDVVF